MKYAHLVIGLAVGLALVVLALYVAPKNGVTTPGQIKARTKEFILGPIDVSKVYPSMTGPTLREQTNLDNHQSGSTYSWITSYSTEVEDNEGAPESLQYLCHAWALVGGQSTHQLMTISQGMPEMVLPAGYAIQIPNKENTLLLSAQVLNDDPETNKRLRYKMTFHYFNDAEAKKLGIKPLRQISLFVNAADVNQAKTAEGLLCDHGEEAGALANAQMSLPTSTDTAAHAGSMTSAKNDPSLFYVPPGHHEYHSPVPKNSPYYVNSGVIHFIKLHLHAYGTSVALIDKTIGRTIWQGSGQDEDGKAVLAKTDFYSDSTGIRIDPSHDYEIMTTYDNTSSQPVDAMAVLRLYVADE